MKKTQVSTPLRDVLLTRIGIIQKELGELKKILCGLPCKKQIKIGGILKGWEVSDKLVQESKKSLFKDIFRT